MSQSDASLEAEYERESRRIRGMIVSTPSRTSRWACGRFGARVARLKRRLAKRIRRRKRNATARYKARLAKMQASTRNPNP